MEIQSYNKELQIANLLFKRLFNNIQIEENGKKTKFQCLIGNRSRIFKGLENPEKNAMYKLPMIIITRTGITKNDERLANAYNEVKRSSHSSNLNYNLFTPVPLDISYEVSIVSKYQEHIDRALGNFIPFFNKDVFVRSEHPKYPGLFFTNQIIMENDIQEDHPSELADTDQDITTCTCNFRFKTYMFCGNQKAEVKTQISTDVYVEKVLSNIVYELTDEDKKHIQDFITKPLSTIIQKEVEVSTLISSEIPISGEPGFIPTINQLYVGFYPVPMLSQYLPHMNWVDSLPQDNANINGYISTDLSGHDVYEPVTTSAEYHPYVDRFIWKIDPITSSDISY